MWGSSSPSCCGLSCWCWWWWWCMLIGALSAAAAAGSAEATDDDADALSLKEACRAKILRKFPDAKCQTTGSQGECRKMCEKLGEETCHWSKGEIRKISCRANDGGGGGNFAKAGDSGVCCCTVKCEDAATTELRLRALFADDSDSAGVCVDSTVDNIRDALKTACQSEAKVRVAKKYCLEEKSGTYFCLKDGKCLGRLCRGCVKHECEIAGRKVRLRVPDAYMKRHLELRDFDLSAAINAEDLPDADSAPLGPGGSGGGGWCSRLDSVAANGAASGDDDDNVCAGVCVDFANLACRGRTASPGSRYQSLGEAGLGLCCCDPICDTKVPEASSSYCTTNVGDGGGGNSSSSSSSTSSASTASSGAVASQISGALLLEEELVRTASDDDLDYEDVDEGNDDVDDDDLDEDDDL